MAIVKVDTRTRRFMITPGDIMERSALLQCPARKWMTQLNMVILPMTPGNARVLKEKIEKGEIRYDLSEDALEFVASIAKILSPAAQDRQWPTWYKFNTDKFPPADHQFEALKRLYPVDSAALLMEMGTMKTRVMIDMMTAHFYERRIQFVIVITPLTVKMSTWQDELANYSPCPYNFIDIDADYRAGSLRVSQDRLTWLVVGVESLSQGKTFRALEPVTKLGIPFACGVDESTRISNWKAICTQAAFDLRRRARVKFIATGFEIKRDMEDLYAQFEFLDPNIIGCGDFVAFRNRYCIMGGFKNKEIIGYNHIDELMGLISPYVYQCDKSILSLPPKLYERRIVQLSPEQKKTYASIKAGDVERVSVENILTKTLRLQQVSSGFYNEDKLEVPDPKTGRLKKLPAVEVEIVSPGKNPKLKELLLVAREISHPMIVWVETMYEFRIVTEALKKRGRVLSIIGLTPKEERRGIIAEFQTGTVPYFVGTTTAGGIGTTLTAARTVVYFSNGQRLEQRVQSEDRAHRKGQTGSVTIIDLVADKTVDVSVLANHTEKIELALYVKAALRANIKEREALLNKFFDGEINQDVVNQIKIKDPIRGIRSEMADWGA
jgi:hypothetical protein